MDQLLNKKFQAGILVLLLLMSCNGSTGKPERVAAGVSPVTVPEGTKNNKLQPEMHEPQSGLQQQKGYENCAALITDLVRSSNAAALSSFKAVQVRIDEMSPEKITIELYTINDVSEDPAVERKADRTIGWLEFFPATGKLQDITNDPDEPQHLRYNTGILQNAGLDKLCFSLQQD